MSGAGKPDDSNGRGGVDWINGFTRSDGETDGDGLILLLVGPLATSYTRGSLRRDSVYRIKEVKECHFCFWILKYHARLVEFELAISDTTLISV